MKRSKVILIVVIILLILIIGISLGFFIAYMLSGTTVNTTSFRREPPVAAHTFPASTDTAAEDTPLPENPIDFTTLQATNSDVYAWLYVPGTNIDYPVVCSSDQSDSYYLDHNIYKQYEFAGTIYSEKKNETDLTDRNTVLYGHNMLNGTMFRPLHYFEDETFFNEHNTIYIYTPGHIYTYRIFAAYEYDNRHLLNSFNNFEDDAVWALYIDYIKNPKSMNVLTRDVGLTTDDRIITLSTCVGTNKRMRYLVQGVLIDDQPTQ